MADPISGAGGSGGITDLVGELVGGGEGGDAAGGILGDVLGGGGGGGGLLGGLLGSGGGDPESMIVDLVGKALGLNDTELGVAKAALGAVTGDPMAIAAGVGEGIQGLASGESPFAVPGQKQDDAKTDAPTDDKKVD